MKRTHYIYFTGLIVLLSTTGCKKYLDIPLPVNQVSAGAPYTNDNGAAAVLNNILGEISNSQSLTNSTGFPLRSGLYTDELQNASTQTDYLAFYSNGLQSANTAYMWSYFYNQLYAINLAVEGVSNASPTALKKRDQWLGEALFLRALMHFYLVNLFGEVPIVTSSDFRTNNTSGRSARNDVYAQIITDLKEAQNLLTAEYRNADGNVTTTDRARPNKAAATAFLARVYLFVEDMANAEAQANTLIGNTATYQLVPPAQTFLAASKEMIWGLAPPATGNYVRDAGAYIITAGKTPLQSGQVASLSASLVNAFEAGDTRFTNWVGTSVVPASGSNSETTYYFANKYKVKTTVATPTEYLVVFRLAEQYLIRAEARLKRNDPDGAKADLDAVRARAGLTGSTATTADEIRDAIINERRIEFFTEWGNRLFDLRRTGKLDGVMNAEAPKKNGAWSSFKQWWPISTNDTQVNPNLLQTPGYQ
ncbi:RagB/SusD family nutrient uptake outer membrane protein [Niastella populi]|uniref:Carbohydrate-binding protein SusD n=1 Tax=Niastella populi TaxID=550983 RepID=A0A1V9FV42_9BACT|nr:RagB/SusD family nutrient uptake outer membrane protein [Niastella populi]OQP62213.1 hypothetical protein A4R26_18225 [Niastella populi]